MRYASIADIYAANREIRERLLTLLSTVSPDEAQLRPDEGGWNAAEIAEHVGIVGNGMGRICSRLVDAAERDGKPADGELALGEKFRAILRSMGSRKAEAPDMVLPTGSMSIGDSISKLDAAEELFAGLRERFEKYDLSQAKFPHPLFGDLNATEWLVLLGLHESRHTDQIERLLGSIRK